MWDLESSFDSLCIGEGPKYRPLRYLRSVPEAGRPVPEAGRPS